MKAVSAAGMELTLGDPIGAGGLADVLAAEHRILPGVSRPVVVKRLKAEHRGDPELELMLVDEIHTPDSSRYWLADSYQARFDAGQEPENIDKEFLRLWFVEHCDPYHDEVLPAAPQELVVELSSRYAQLYERITGREFVPVTSPPVRERLAANLASVVG